MSPDPTNGENQHEKSAREHARSARSHAAEAGTQAAAAAAEFRDAATEVAEELRNRMAHITDDLKDQAQGFQREAEKYVRQHPTKSVLTAVGVGFVLGVLFRR